MRRSLMSALSAVAVIAAFGVVPAVAAAESYVYDIEAQEPVEVGTKVGGVSGNTTIFGTVGPFTYECPKITYSGKVTKNPPINKDAEVQLEAENFICDTHLPVSTNYRLEFLDLTVSARQFFAAPGNDGAIDYWIDSGVMKFYYLQSGGPTLHSTCTLEEKDLSATYSVASPPLLSYTNMLVPYSSKEFGCWLNQPAYMTGSFSLDAAEEGLNISVYSDVES